VKRFHHLPFLFSFMVLIFVTSCGGGGGDGRSDDTNLPSMEPLTFSPQTLKVESQASFQISFAFQDRQGDLGGGSLKLNYEGAIYSATLPESLTGVTNGSHVVSMDPITVSSTLGDVGIEVWIQDRAGNTSNSVFFIVTQMGFGPQFWGSNENDKMVGIAAGNGNIYVVGSTSGDLDGEENQGGTDAFISMIDSLGRRQWTKLIGNAGNDAANAIAVDISGNAYVVGELDFADRVSGDAFLRIYDSSGELLKDFTIVAAGTTELGSVTAMGVAMDDIGNVYLTGHVKSDLDGERNPGAYSPFLIKYEKTDNESWERQWTRLWGNSSINYAYGIAVDGSGCIYVVGSAYGSWDLQVNMGHQDAFITKFNDEGVHQWTRFFGYESSDAARAVALDYNGDIYVTGEMIMEDTLNDGFISRFSPAGDKLWISFLSSPHCDDLNAVALDDRGYIYVAGWTRGSLENLDGLPNIGGNDAFTSKFSDTGDLQWTKLWGTGNHDRAVGLAVTSEGEIFVAGDTLGDFYGYENAGGSDLYLLKFNSDGQMK
jgi:hypothetical protein